MKVSRLWGKQHTLQHSPQHLPGSTFLRTSKPEPTCTRPRLWSSAALTNPKTTRPFTRRPWRQASSFSAEESHRGFPTRAAPLPRVRRLPEEGVATFRGTEIFLKSSTVVSARSSRLAGPFMTRPRVAAQSLQGPFEQTCQRLGQSLDSEPRRQALTRKLRAGNCPFGPTIFYTVLCPLGTPKKQKIQISLSCPQTRRVRAHACHHA